MTGATEHFLILVADIARFAGTTLPREYAEEEEPVSVPLHEKLGISHERLTRALLMIPKIDQDILHMSFVLGKRQQDIAAMMCRTQAAISYRIDRAAKRLRFVLSVPEFTEAELREMLGKALPHDRYRPQRIEIMVAMWRTTSQYRTAVSAGTSQGRVRHTVFRTTAILRKTAERDPSVKPAALWFGTLIDKRAWNALTEVAWNSARLARTPLAKKEAASGIRLRVVDAQKD